MHSLSFITSKKTVLLICVSCTIKWKIEIIVTNGVVWNVKGTTDTEEEERA